MNVVDMVVLSYPRDNGCSPRPKTVASFAVQPRGFKASSAITGNKKRLARQRAQSQFALLRSSARVSTLPDLAPSLTIGGCREIYEPVLSLALDECRGLMLHDIKHYSIAGIRRKRSTSERRPSFRPAQKLIACIR